MSLTLKKTTRTSQAEQQKLNELANLQLFLQELSDVNGLAVAYFRGRFMVGNKERFMWLLPTETLEDMMPNRVDYILRNLAWFKRQILKMRS